MSESPEKTSEEKVPEPGTLEDSSEPEAKITTAPAKKEKDPKKVAQGKRLAQISKAAKEKKMREQINNETKLDFSVDYKSVLYVAGSATLVFVGMYLYFSQTKQQEPTPQNRAPVSPKKPQPKKFISLFD